MKKLSKNIPEKLFFRISEVAKLVGVEPYVLRFWESEFKTLTPEKNRGGWRVYRKKDVERVLEIKRLLYEEGFTIEGARKRMARHNGSKDAGDEPGSPTHGKTLPLFRSNEGEHMLQKVKTELESILTLLNKR
ncbi:MAG: MerR family transcriptional regulator [Acidobacteriia bacterium]|nr:MerR family transcriptional regulator [Terriglobia bacterium]